MRADPRFLRAVTKTSAGTSPLIRLRMALEKTQADMATAAGFEGDGGRIRWQGIETGKNKLSTDDARKALGRALGVPPDDAVAFARGEVPLAEFLPRVKIPAPAPAPQREETRELDKRYPGRTSAVIAWRALGRDERAVERVESMGMDRDDDPDPEEWFAELAAADARIKAEDKRKATTRPELDDDYGAPKLPPRKR